MKKFKEIKEIKHDIKVKEIKSGANNSQEEIETLTSKEVPITESGLSVISAPKPIVLGSETVAGRNELTFQPLRSQPAEGPRQADVGGTRLYDVGRGMGNESEGRKAYKTVEDIQGPTLRAAHVGRDFAMGRGGSGLPEDAVAQNLQGDFRDQAVDRKYDSKSMEEKARGKRTHGYAWEE